MATKEIKSLTGLRGVLAIYVVSCHFFQYCMTSLKGQDYFFFDKYPFSFFIHGYLAVDAFFILSAFVITLTSARLFEGKFDTDNYKVFMRKRWLRLYPTYFIILLFGYVVVNDFNRTPNFLLSLTLLNLVFGVHHLLLHLWSLGAEWMMYMIYPLFYKLSVITKKGYWKYALVIIGALALSTVGWLNGKSLAGDYMLIVFNPRLCLLRCVGDYIIGMGMFLIWKENKHVFLMSNLTSYILVVTIIGTLFFPKLDVVTVLLFMLLIINMSTDTTFAAKLLSMRVPYFFGVISYPLYLINSLVFLKMEDIQAFLSNSLNLTSIYSLGVVFMTISIVLAIIFTYLIEMPLIAWLTKVIKEDNFFFRRRLATANS